jgi:hypothetical protein
MVTFVSVGTVNFVCPGWAMIFSLSMLLLGGNGKKDMAGGAKRQAQ